MIVVTRIKVVIMMVMINLVLVWMDGDRDSGELVVVMATEVVFRLVVVVVVVGDTSGVRFSHNILTVEIPERKSEDS